MIIESKVKELYNKIIAILSYPYNFGISIDTNKKIKIMDVFESIVITKDWHWINVNDILDILKTNNIQIIENDYVIALVDQVQRMNFEQTDYFKLPEQCFIPIPQLERPILFDNIKQALLISGHRILDFDKSIIKKISKSELVSSNISFSVANSTILLEKELNNIGEVIAKEALERELNKLYEEIMFSEVLYIDDEANRDNACRYLSKICTQIDLEEKLVSHLNDSNPEVRANICLALYSLISSEMFDVNEVLPLHYSKNLSAQSVLELLELLQNESDPYVFNSAIGILKILNYSKQLRNLVYQVNYVVGKVYKNFSGTQIRKDCENFIKHLQEIINHSKDINSYEVKKEFIDLAKKENFEKIILFVNNIKSSHGRLLMPSGVS